jgi:hypothetical protein
VLYHVGRSLATVVAALKPLATSHRYGVLLLTR